MRRAAPAGKYAGTDSVQQEHVYNMDSEEKKKALIEEARALFAFFDEKPGGYYPDHYTGRMFSVNVKMHRRQPQAIDIITKKPRRYHKALIERFDDETVQHIWNDWIENEARDLMEMVTSGGTMQAMDAAAWKKCAGDALDAGKPTGYLAIDELKTESAKRAKLAEFVANDAELIDAFSIIAVRRGTKYRRSGTGGWLHPETREGKKRISAILALEGLHPDDRARYEGALKGVKTGYGKRGCSIFGEYQLLRPYTETDAGFYGRSGGHFCFPVTFDTDGLEAVMDWPDDMKTEEAEAVVLDARKARARVQYVLDYVKRAHAGLDFGHELEHHIDESIEDLKADERRRRKERNDVALKAKSARVAGVRVVDCLNHVKESIRRNATSIVKEL